MHIEILVEDASGKVMLEAFIPKIIGDTHTFNVIAYKGIGRIPPGLTSTGEVSNRILLDNLPRLLKGYGRTFAEYPPDYRAAVILVCDLDNKSLHEFRKQLDDLLNTCNPKPEARFCIAIEEGEAWLLGDKSAIQQAYPKAKMANIARYVQDSICGTWEKLADVLYPGGSAVLSRKSYREIGGQKAEWAKKIPPFMNTQKNASPSFKHFCGELLELVA
jgi:hypothetical protein